MDEAARAATGLGPSIAAAATAGATLFPSLVTGAAVALPLLAIGGAALYLWKQNADEAAEAAKKLADENKFLAGQVEQGLTAAQEFALLGPSIKNYQMPNSLLTRLISLLGRQRLQ